MIKHKTIPQSGNSKVEQPLQKRYTPYYIYKYTGNRFTLKPKYALKNPATLFAKQMFFNWDFQMTYYASLQLKGLQNCGRWSLKVKKRLLLDLLELKISIANPEDGGLGQHISLSSILQFCSPFSFKAAQYLI